MYDKAYIEYLAHFHGTRDYFECHEVLEKRWMMDRPLDRNSIFVAFIQLAVALYHQRRGNDVGALRLLKKGIQKFEIHASQVASYGLDREAFFVLLFALKEEMKSCQPYQSIQLPIQDKKLERLVQNYCKNLSCEYPSISNLHNTDLVHKHILRKKKNAK